MNVWNLSWGKNTAFILYTFTFLFINLIEFFFLTYAVIVIKVIRKKIHYKSILGKGKNRLGMGINK